MTTYFYQQVFLNATDAQLLFFVALRQFDTTVHCRKCLVLFYIIALDTVDSKYVFVRLPSTLDCSFLLLCSS